MSQVHQTEATTSHAPHVSAQQSSKHRAYVSSVDKALKSFEATTEWADLIAALGKLGKVLHTNAKLFNDVPNPVTVAKRLSQCLHPALPSGVHLKALETYKQVFAILGRTENLPRYLYLFAIGLFPLMDHCGIKVKSELLTIFETYLLPLGPALRSALPGFVAAVLLGLEEGTEFYGRSFTLLEQLLQSVGAETFYASLWQAVLGSPSVRLPALTFVNAKWEKRKPLSEQFTTMSGGDNADLMSVALCAVAEDSGSALVQRNLLDFLCAALPLNSAHVTQNDLVQILRRSLFVVLRRDMSLNRRLYQWLLNRSNDVAFSSLPVGGTEDQVDLDFFRTFTLPLIKLALLDFLKLDTVEIPSTKTPIGATGGAWDSAKESQTHFTEVRVCRLLHYFLDRPELGELVLRETLSMFLEFACRHDRELVRSLQKDCEEVDASFSSSGTWDLIVCGSKASEAQKNRRLDEIRKNFNSLLNALDAGFLWQYLEEFFINIHSEENNDDPDVDELEMTIDEKELRLFRQHKRREHIQLYPLIVLFCVKTVQLDSHGDIRGRHLARLLQTILSTIRQKGCGNFSHDNLVMLLVVARRLIVEINQSVSAVESGASDDRKLSDDGNTADGLSCKSERFKEHFREKYAEEQQIIESCLLGCCQLLAHICQWYAAERDRDKTGVMNAISSLLRDFADFPLYCFKFDSGDTIYAGKDISLSGTQHYETGVEPSGQPSWLTGLLKVIDANSWLLDVNDFDLRANMLDLLLYLYVRSVSVHEQHRALMGRQYRNNYDMSESRLIKTTTTVLLKPFLSVNDITVLEREEVFKMSAQVLWSCLDMDIEAFNNQIAVNLLCRLHSRKSGESSSDVEDIIVAHLTSPSKAVSCQAAKKFRDLWALSRNVIDSETPQKPMNRVTMILLGALADDSGMSERTELKAIAHSWLIDCAKHNDLHKILQILFLMLLNPATARVSIQFVQIQSRITREKVPTMPAEANAISFATISGKQTFHHVCRDIDTPLPENAPVSSTAPWNDFTFIDCTKEEPWLAELKRRFLLPSVVDGSNELAEEEKPVKFRPSHKRQVSNIPQFDEEEEAESFASVSLDCTEDAEVLEVLQYIVDCVVEEEESEMDAEERFENAISDFYVPLKKDSTATTQSASVLPALCKEEEEPVIIERMRDRVESTPARYNGIDPRAALRDKNGNEDAISVVGSLSTAQPISSISPMRPDTIKRIKCGHRRQDSLQESIFSTTTKELRLFDPSELPKLTCPGDAKQPLLDEPHAHMLFYAESPRTVDLGRAEKIFRTVAAILRNGGGSSLGRMIVSCMVFTNTSHLKSTETNGQSVHQLAEYLIRHYRHMQGEGFWPSDPDAAGAGSLASGSATMIPGSDKNRSPTFFEIFSTIILYFLRSYYLNSPTSYVSTEDLTLSWKCKIAALDCFSELMRILNDLVKEISSRDFAGYVQHIYRFTRTQRVIISLMLTAVPAPPSQKGWRIPITVDIAEFNNGPPRSDHFCDLLFAYHKSLLNLASSLVVLEHNMYLGLRTFSQNLGITFEPLHENRMVYNSPQNRSTLRDPRYLVVELKLFIIVTLNALKRCPERHELWLRFVVDALPHLDRTLPTFAVHVVEQLCRNLYACVSSSYNDELCLAGLEIDPFSTVEVLERSKYFTDFRLLKPDAMSLALPSEKYPFNYTLTILEALTSILHFCMIDTTTTNIPFMFLRTPISFTPNSPTFSPNAVSATTISSPSSMGHNSSHMSSMIGTAVSVIPGTKGATELINNLFGKVFTTGDSVSHQPSLSKYDAKPSNDWLIARHEVTKVFPSALAVISDVWALALKDKQPRSPIGSPQHIRVLCLEMLGPIAKTHTTILIHGFAMVWLTRSSINTNVEADQPCFTYSPAQMGIAELVLAMKASLPVNALISSIVEMLKEFASKSAKTSPGSEKQQVFPVEVALLELLHGCIRLLPIHELRDCWVGLNILFFESPLANLPPRATFLEFIILVDFVRLYGSQTVVEDKSMSRSVQDACQRLTDAVNSVVGWQLESTTWLKRTLVVRQDNSSQKTPEMSPTLEMKTAAGSMASEANSMKGSTFSLAGSSNRMSAGESLSQYTGSVAQLSQSDSKKSSTALRSSVKDTNNNKRDPTNSTKALFLLAENLAELIDSICKSEDKERLLPTLQAVWNNTLPYLRAKSARNVRFFLASSQFLASISTFNYMRPVWKKTSMDLLFDQSFFKMDIHALKQWLTVIDNLMTNDKTSFKELLARIPTGPTTTLSNLITSRDQEYELRAQALKRLAFAVLSSQMDQYSSNLPDIQERLSDNLRLSQVPVVHAQVFICYRVLLIRMKPINFVSMWPSMVTELVQVLMQIEQQINDANPSPSSDDLRCSKDEQWMQLYLSACKLLETLCTLPAGYMAQFQMCHWAFVSCLDSDTTNDAFIPFATRIINLLNAKYGEMSSSEREMASASLCNIKTLTSFHELQPFFQALATQHKTRTVESHYNSQEDQLRDANYINGSLSLKAAIARLEHALYVDFADHWQL